jgi:hypothetical protein
MLPSGSMYMMDETAMSRYGRSPLAEGPPTYIRESQRTPTPSSPKVRPRPEVEAVGLDDISTSGVRCAARARTEEGGDYLMEARMSGSPQEVFAMCEHLPSAHSGVKAGHMVTERLRFVNMWDKKSPKGPF